MADDGKRKGSGNGFQGLGLSDPVYRGIVRMGFRVSDDGLMSLNPSFLGGAPTEKSAEHSFDDCMAVNNLYSKDRALMMCKTV
jgi:hypothetical protein